MTNQELKQRNIINLKAALIAAVIPTILLVTIGYAAVILAPVAFVIIGAVVRANMMHKFGFNPERY